MEAYDFLSACRAKVHTPPLGIVDGGDFMTILTTILIAGNKYS
jgi:hypothetical protein